MKKFTKISLLVAAVLLGMGIIFCGIASVMGVGFATMRQMAQNGEFDTGHLHIRDTGIYFGDNDEEWDLSSGEDEAYAAYDMTSVKNISLDVDAASIYVRSSSQASTISVAMTWGKEKYYTCNLDGDTLKIAYKYHGNLPLNGVEPEIEICLPKNVAFADVNLSIGAAEMIFEDTALLTCENLTIDVGAGRVESEWLEVAGTAEISIGAGEVIIDHGKFKDMVLDCDMGNIEVDGVLKGNLKGKCSMGNIAIDLLGKESDYNYELSCNMGNLELNERTYSGLGGEHYETNEGAIGTITLDCDMGNIELDIEPDIE